jgi:hypothetical protein
MSKNKNNSNNDKNKNKNGNAEKNTSKAPAVEEAVSEASEATPSATEATPAASTAVRRVVERRPVLVLYAAKIKEAKTEVVRIATSLEAWTRQDKISEAQGTKLGELLSLTKELSPRFDEFEANFAALAALGFVPSTIQVRSPKFSTGDAVRVEAGDWMTHYTKSGIYTEGELSNLAVVKVGVKEILCRTAGGREVLIRTAGHLEPLSPSTEPEPEQPTS